jgi:uracil-DNA glycosylase family 4
MTPPSRPAEPAGDCRLCSRLAAFRDANREKLPGFHNAPVPAFGAPPVKLLIVGLAPGLKGANRTGRPFTGDYAGDLLYPTLVKFGWAEGRYEARPDDGLQLKACRITNAVRCVPPANKPETSEIRNCNAFLKTEIAALAPGLEAVLSLGGVSHGAVLTALGFRKSAYRFGHGALHRLPGGLLLADSYHCSRYNTNTGRLTGEMFEGVFRALNAELSR